MTTLKQVITSIALFALTTGSSASIKSFDIRDFGAIADGQTINTNAIQKAIDTCSSEGGGVVEISGGSYVSGTILLKDNITLNLAKDATLLGSKNPFDYRSIDPFTDATGQIRGKCLIGAIDSSNISITGTGVIDGRGASFKKEALAKTFQDLKISKEKLKTLSGDRPFLIRFVRTSKISVNDIHLRQAAAWACHFYQCDGILVDGVDIYSHAHKNNDGIDLDSSRNALIQNCTIDTGDDAICFKSTSPVACENVEVFNCTLKSDWGAIKFGTESMGDFRSIRIEHCKIYDTRGGGIKILSVDGANIENVSINNIVMDNVDMPIFIRLGERLRTYRDAPQQTVGSIDKISIQNVTASTRSLSNSRVSPPSGIFITGTPENKVGRISLENIKITLPGGGDSSHIKNEVEEQEKRYPEFSFFGVLPAYGIMTRHVKDIEIKNIELELESKDERLPSLFIDSRYTVDNLDVHNAF